MQGGKKHSLVFVLPFTEMVSNYVRAQCLDGYEPKDWHFIYLKGTYPNSLNFVIARTLYRYWFYLKNLLKIKIQSQKTVAYFIKPQSPLLLLLVRHLFWIKIMVDVNDPYHLSNLMGAKVTKALFNNADWLIFESKEYCNYWAHCYNNKSSIVSDTPQHECIYLDSTSRSKSVIWIGSPHTSPYLVDFIEHFKLFNDYGYKIRLIGCDKDTAMRFQAESINFSEVNQYDQKILANELTESLISFVPMPDDALFKLRGNLKVKVSMGHGCLTIASRNSMHENLIQDGFNGFLFDSLIELNDILNSIQNRMLIASIATAGNRLISEKYTRKIHAEKLVGIAANLSK